MGLTREPQPDGPIEMYLRIAMMPSSWDLLNCRRHPAWLVFLHLSVSSFLLSQQGPTNSVAAIFKKKPEHISEPQLRTASADVGAACARMSGGQALWRLGAASGLGKKHGPALAGLEASCDKLSLPHVSNRRCEMLS